MPDPGRRVAQALSPGELGRHAGAEARGVSEIEAHAREYGLAPVRWPVPYPANSLIAMRAATWADEQGHGRDFAEAAFASAFRDGVDLSARAAVLGAAERAGLRAADLDRALDDPELELSLRRATDHAISEGVYGVPTFDVAGRLWWGDQLLPAAAAHRQLGD